MKTVQRVGMARLAWREVRALWIAVRRRDVPLAAKAVALFVAAYAISPVDLSMDWIPVLGWIDDATVAALGIALAMRLVPAQLREEIRAQAAGDRREQKND